jgi:hypothetical protein
MLGIADAFTRRSVLIIDGRHPLHLLQHPTGYAAALASIIGIWLMQNAFSAAPLHASLPAVTAAEPAAGMVLGVLVFGDRVHISPWLVAVQILGVIAMVTGVIVVARAPVFRDLRLRQLPHAALERLHPASEPSAAAVPSGGIQGPPNPGAPVEPGDSATGLAGAGQSAPDGERPSGTACTPASETA